MRFRIWAAAFVAACLTGLGLLLPAAAGASVLPHVHVVGNGEAGYSAASGNGFRNTGATVITHAAAQNIGGVGQGGIGSQLCDPNNGFGLQIGLVSNGSTFTVEYANGTLPGANGHNCEGNGLLTAPALLHPTTLSGLAVGDPVQVFVSFRNVHVWRWVNHHRRHVWQGRAKFQAFDTAGFDVFTAWVHTRADWNLDEAGAGIVQDTTGMSADTPLTAVGGPAPYDGISGPTKTGAHNLVVDFSGVFVNGFGLGGPGFPFALSNTTEVATTAGGLHSNPAIVAPNGSGGTNPVTFSVWAGNPTV